MYNLPTDVPKDDEETDKKILSEPTYGTIVDLLTSNNYDTF